MTQAALFDADRGPWIRHGAPETSRQAAKRLAPFCGKQERRVLGIIACHCGLTRGITRQEIADSYGIRIQSVTGRVRTLILKGFIEEDGTRNGGKLLFVTTAGRTQLHEATRDAPASHAHSLVASPLIKDDDRR